MRIAVRQPDEFALPVLQYHIDQEVRVSSVMDISKLVR